MGTYNVRGNKEKKLIILKLPYFLPEFAIPIFKTLPFKHELIKMARNQVFNTGEESLKFIVQSSELLKA